jgi:beta-glucosidase
MLFMNRIYLHPLFTGGYPQEYITKLKNEGYDLSFMNKDDFDYIKVKTGFLGINYYNRNFVKYDETSWFNYSKEVDELPITSMGWEVSPNALQDVVEDIRNNYTDIPIIITENGSAFDDELLDGKINDIQRISYFSDHLKVIKNLRENYNVTGYYAWSLMDNFEWAFGYTKRFGIVYVDYETQVRLKKESFYFLKDYIKNSK